MPVPEAVAVAALAIVVAATALLVDSRAHATFDAPKRLAHLLGVPAAAFAAFAFSRPSRRPRDAWRELPRAARAALLAAAAGLVWFGVSSLLSPRRPASLDAFRAMVLSVLLLPLGASRAFGKGKRLLLAVFLAAAVANSVISLLQSRGIQPFELQTFGTRNLTGALAGNVGYLASVVAFALVLALGIVLASERRLFRVLAVGASLVFVATLVANRNLTALVSAAAGAVALLLARFGRRSLLPIGAVGVAIVVAVLAVAPLRQRAVEAISALRSRDWDRLTTYRTGAWAAALEMTRERPVTGWGPGTYAAEFVPHRLTAEIRARRRFVNPLVTSSYSEAHCDYLQAFSEAGIPGGVAALTAVGTLLLTVAGRSRRTAGSDLESAILLGILVAGAVAALTWFPLQRPISAVPLLLAAGRGWRLAAGEPDEAAG